jgi:hypothetical protein
MTEAQSVGRDPATDPWPQLVADRLKTEGQWAALAWLQQERKSKPSDLALRGYVEIIRAAIVRDFLGQAKGTKSVPRLTPDFLNDFDKFSLSAQEGYLISQIDGRTNIEKLLKLSPFDPFTTYFSLARMYQVHAIEISE